MKFLSENSNNLRSLAVRSILVLLCLVLYFTVLRPVRAQITTHIYQPVLSIDEQQSLSYPVLAQHTGFRIFDPDDSEFGFALYSMFGSFFLFGLIGFIFLYAPLKAYLWLVLWHFILAWPVLLFTRFGLHNNEIWLHAAMFTQNFLVHWMTILAIPVLFLYQKGGFKNRGKSDKAEEAKTMTECSNLKRPSHFHNDP